MASLEEAVVPEQEVKMEIKDEEDSGDKKIETKVENGSEENWEAELKNEPVAAVGEMAVVVEDGQEREEKEKGDVVGESEEKLETVDQEDNDDDVNDETLDASQDTEKDRTSPSKEEFLGIIRLDDQVGTIFRSLRYHAILVQFMYKGKMEVAMAPSSRMHINGSRPLLKVCWRDILLRGFLREGDTINFDVVCTKKTLPQKGKQKMRKINPVQHNWNIELMWKGTKPDVSLLKTEEKFDAKEQYVDTKLKHLEAHMKEVDEFNAKKVDCKKMQGVIKEFLSATHGTMTSGENCILFKNEDVVVDGEKMTQGQTLADVFHCGDAVTAFVKEKQVEYGPVNYTMQATVIWKGSNRKQDQVDIGVPESWFLVTSHFTKKRLPGHESATEKDQEGVITEIHRPKGGVIHLANGKDVWFHRTRVYINKKKLGIHVVLEEALHIGDTVHCNILPNGDQIYVDDPVAYVGLLVWKGEKPEQIQQPKNLEDVLRAKVFKLDHPQENGVESGLLVIGGTGPSAGKKVAFERKNVYFYGLSLEKTDLAYLLSKDDLVFCTIEALPENEGGTVTHKAIKVWYGQRSGPDVTEEIRLPKFSHMVKHLSKVRLDVDTFERVVFGGIEPKHKRKMPLIPPRLGTVSARVVSLARPFQKSAVKTAFFSLEHGGTSGQSITLHRKNLKVWGIRMQKGDLSLVLLKDDRIICNLKENSSGKISKFTALNAWIGSNSKREEDENLEELEKNANFNKWLQRLSLDMDKFQKMVQGKIAPRIFLPFKSEFMTARVVSVDAPQRTGIQSGTITIEKGTFRGKQATFHRKCLFVYSHYMDKADLGYLFVKDQKMFCEVQEVIVPDKIGSKRNKREYRAALCWIGSKRPAYDPKTGKVKTIAYPGFEGWLKKRNLNPQTFKKLVEGKLGLLPRRDIQVPIVGMKFPNEKPSRMMIPPLAPLSGLLPPAWLPGMNPQFGMGRPFQPPLLSHPPQPLQRQSPGIFMNPVTIYKKKMSSMLTTVLNINSLDDPALNSMIQDEETAQLTEFISKAFFTVLEKYKDKQKEKQKNMNPMWSHMMGVGGVVERKPVGFSARTTVSHSVGSSSGTSRDLNRAEYHRTSSRNGGYSEFDERKRQHGPDGRGDAPYSKFYRVDNRMDSYKQPQQGYQYNYKRFSNPSGFSFF